MRVRKHWIGGLAGLLVLNGAAWADVTDRQINDPTDAFGQSPAGPYGQGVYNQTGPLPVPFETMARLAEPGIPALAKPADPEYSAVWLAGLPVATGDKEWECLAKAIYFEARGESINGQFAIAEVILNRVDSPLYPKSICRVVKQGGQGGCQFSFVCDGQSDAIREKAAYETAGKIARLMLDGMPRALTHGATHFHAGSVRPGWARRYAETAEIGAHRFYRASVRQ